LQKKEFPEKIRVAEKWINDSVQERAAAFRDRAQVLEEDLSEFSL